MGITCPFFIFPMQVLMHIWSTWLPWIQCILSLGLVPEELSRIVTALHWQVCDRKLSQHPDQLFRSYIVEGIRYQFRVGFDYTRPLKSATSNMSSFHHHPQLKSEYLAEECAEGHIMGLLARDFSTKVHVSSFGLIPKKTPGEWRLIVDLSSPEGKSVNDGINEYWCSLRYVTVEDALHMIAALGRGSLLAKVDVRKAYRNIPIHPAGRSLLGMVWEGKLFIDTALPFGLRSAPNVFTAVADAAEWIAQQEGVDRIIHYLDDFLVVGPPKSYRCKQHIDKVLELFQDLGLPVAPSKLEGPATCLCFLGIETDTESLEIRLPADKLQRLQSLLRAWRTRSSCRRHELESLVGHLSLACYVVRAGKSFLRRLIELLGVACRGHHFLQLNSSHRADLCWWEAFISSLNHAVFFRGILSHSSHFSFYTDASGSLGCGEIWSPHWFQVRWQDHLTSQWPELGADSITYKEVLPTVWGLAIWGRLWFQASVIVYCDNQGVVAAVKSGYSKVSRIAHLLHYLFFFIKARYDIDLEALHIPGASNQLADTISRHELGVLFYSGYPRPGFTNTLSQRK